MRLAKLPLSSLLALSLAFALAGCGDDSSADDDDDDDADAGVPTELMCSDGTDDDSDGDVDCEDADCALAINCIELNCDNGQDDDGDEYTDCDDENCDGIGLCEHGAERTCDDGEDNDDDQATDCRDDDCIGIGICEGDTELTCDDGEDNDLDDLVDCYDDDCALDVACAPESACGDDVDNDADGDFDCDDADCAGDALCLPESLCGDALDNDGDGGADCLDEDCLGLDGCEPIEATCADGLDNDTDGDLDCADADCALACAAVCPVGSDPIVYVAATPVSIPSPGFAQASIESFNSAVITSMTAQLDVTHGRTADLKVYLTAPDNTQIILANEVGTGANFVDTVFDQAAAQAIGAGSNPFTGSFQPSVSLDAMLDRAPLGTWRVGIYDDTAANAGQITGMALTFCVCTGTDCEQSAVACSDGVDNDGDTLSDCDDPSCDAYPGCVPETACADGGDNDFDGAADCDDADCDGLDACEHALELTCDDLFDNDADGEADCLDADCDVAPVCVPEVDCGDGLDNDADGATDCFDPACVDVAPCQLGAETLCSDGVDNDADGAADCDDADCNIACALACPSGSTAVDLLGGNLPLAIGDNTTINSPATYDGFGLVTKLAVETDITHTYDGDLVLSLVSPGSTVLTLANQLGGTGENYVDTIFLDGAPTAITAGAPPYTGYFAPEQPLATLNGIVAAGTWNFRVADQAGGDTGSLTTFVLHMCVCDGPECEAEVACLDGQDNDGDGLADCDDSSCAGFGGCLPETICDDDVDNDFDGDADCHDLECDGVASCEVGAELTCDDGFDNDTDGLTDCLDADCDLAAECVPESDCGDGVDNDADGDEDCYDAGCVGVAPCELGTETLCGDGIDNDADGGGDCDDTDCLCGLLTCVGQEEPYQFSASDLPKAISDNATFTSSIAVATAGTVGQVVVRFSATHTFDGDLDISLRSPANTTRDLSSDNGGSNENYLGTIFSDTAATAITSGTAPFTGQFRPEESLGAFDGQVANGAWVLSVADDAGGDQGQWTQYDLALCIAP